MKQKRRRLKSYERFESITIEKINNAIPKRTNRYFKKRGHSILKNL